MSKYVGDLLGIEIRTSEHVPDGEVYVMNKKMLDSFKVTNIKLTRWQKVKRYFSNLWAAIRGL